jgi:N6-adenosine-specific RNA methylase IME4
MELKIKEEFKKLIPPLTAEEFKQLETNCIDEGIRDAIVTWQGFIIDGHNRYKIATDWQLSFKTIEKAFESEYHVRKWMAQNQIGRRNLTDFVKGELFQIIEDCEKEIGKQKLKEIGKLYGEGHAKDKEEPLSIIDKPSHNTQKIVAEKLGWSTGKKAQFDVVKKVAPEEIKEKLRTGELTINQAYQDIKKEEKKEQRVNEIKQQIEAIESGELPELKGVFDIISFDPPWPYEGESKEITTYDPNGRRVANPYPEMSIEQIKQIEVPSSDNSVVFLWTTHKFLNDAFDILKTWGFQYKATLVWDKEKMGMGAWLRMQCEFCLIGIKGRPYWDNTKYRDIIRESRREHSRKPDSFFEMVENITLGRKLEYFSREKRNGWEVFGNDINKF